MNERITEASFRWSRLPAEVADALHECEPLLSYRSGPKGTSMYVQFRVPPHLHGRIAAEAADAELMAMRPPVQRSAPVDLLRRLAMQKVEG